MNTILGAIISIGCIQNATSRIPFSSRKNWCIRQWRLSRFRQCILIFLLICGRLGWCASGDLCPGFSAGTGIKGVGALAGNILRAMVVQPDGKIILAGQFDQYNGTQRKSIVRIHPDGSIDSTFDPQEGVSGEFEAIDSVALQPDGKILITGSFVFVNGRVQPHVARLCPDGRLDIQFHGFVNTVLGSARALALQQDGKILVGGQFGHANGVSRNVANLVRFNSDGSLDDLFKGSDLGISSVGKIIVHNTNSIYVVASLPFQTPSTKLLKLNANGEIDRTFTAPSTASQLFHVDTSGESYIWLSSSNLLARLNADGSLDNTFDATSSKSIYSDGILDLIFQENGKIVILTPNSIGIYSRLFRLNSNGSFDSTLNITLPSPPRFEAQHLAIAPGSTCILVAGDIFDEFNLNNAKQATVQLRDLGDISSTLREDWPATNGQPSVCIDYWTDSTAVAGLVDASFSVENHGTVSGQVHAAVASVDCKSFYIGGEFVLTSSNGFVSRNIAKLNENGASDPTFSDIGVSSLGPIQEFFLQEDKLLVRDSQNLVRLLSSGVNDSDYSAGIPSGQRSIDCLFVDSNGRVLVGGEFVPLVGGRKYLVRLNGNGSTDVSFNSDIGQPVSAVGRSVRAVGQFADGKYIAVFQRGSESSLHKLNPNGVIDPTFTAALPPRPFIYCLAVDEFNRILIGGSAEQSDGKRRGFLLRLDSLGHRDTAFNSTVGPANQLGGYATAGSEVTAIKLQPDGRIVCGGAFEQINGFYALNIARLFDDGKLDDSFHVQGLTTISTVNGIQLLADGRVLTSFVGANFDIPDSPSAPMLYHGDPRIYCVSKSNAAFRAAFKTAYGKSYYVEQTTALSVTGWNRLALVDGDDRVHTFGDETISESQRFYRLRIATPPSVASIERLNPVNESWFPSLLTFRVRFNNHVTSIDAADFTLSVMSGNLSGTRVEAVRQINGTTTEVDVISGAGIGVLRLDVLWPGAVINDTAGNGLRAAFTNGQTYNIDERLPRVISVTRLNPMTQVTASAQVVFKVAFSEHVNGIDQFWDFKVSRVSGNLPILSILSVSSSSGNSVEVTVYTGSSGGGEVRLDVNSGASIADDDGNNLLDGFSGGETYVISR